MAADGEAVNEPHKTFDTILVLDFGYAVLLAVSLVHSLILADHNTPI